MGHTLGFPLGPVGSAPAAEVEAVGVGRSRARVPVVPVAVLVRPPQRLLAVA